MYNITHLSVHIFNYIPGYGDCLNNNLKDFPFFCKILKGLPMNQEAGDKMLSGSLNFPFAPIECERE